MSVNRKWYGVRVVGVSPTGANAPIGTYSAVHGLQSFNASDNFGIEPVNEMGQGVPYDYVEDIPEVTISMEKALDGTPPIYCLAFSGLSTNIMTAAEDTCSLKVQTCASNNLNAEGTVEQECTLTGLYLSSVGYNFIGDGPSTETIEFIGNYRKWEPSTNDLISGTLAWGSDYPASGVVLREDIDLNNCEFPSADMGSNAIYQSINISANLGRNDITQLGSKLPYLKSLQLPVEVTTEINTLSVGTGISYSGYETDCTPTSFTANRQITIATCQGLTVNVGDKNRLRSVSENGGGTDGSDATLTYSYVTYNDLTISHENSTY